MKLQEEKIAAIQEKLELAEQKLAQYAKLPEMEEQLKQRMEALTQVRRPNQVRRGIISCHIINSPFFIPLHFNVPKIRFVSRKLIFLNMHYCHKVFLFQLILLNNNNLLLHALNYYMYDI